MIQIRVASKLTFAVETDVAPAARFARAVSNLGGAELSPIAARLKVTADPSAPKRRFLPDEYSTRIEWVGAERARVDVNGATGTIEWAPAPGAILEAELAIYPEGAPESLGMFMRLLAAILLPVRGALLVHAGAVVTDGKSVLFFGESGAGKTTTARRAAFRGALRIADDMAVVDVGAPISVESCSFDRASRLPGRSGRSWPLAGAYAVQKGAAEMRIDGPVVDPLRQWCAAVMSPALPPARAEALLALIAKARAALPPRGFDVAPRGDVLSAVRYSLVAP
jgi:hypothetical protein